MLDSYREEGEDNSTLILTLTQVLDEDIEQEALIYELETGKKANKLIIRNKLASTDRLLYYGKYHKDLDFAKVPWEGNKCEQAVIDVIVDYALQQPERIKSIILGFLEAEDKEGILDDVLEELDLIKVEVIDSSMSMADIMRRALPATKEELIQLITSVSPETKRPAATVRQWIRTETRKGAIYLGDDGQYYHST